MREGERGKGGVEVGLWFCGMSLSFCAFSISRMDVGCFFDVWLALNLRSRTAAELRCFSIICRGRPSSFSLFLALISFCN